MGSSGYPTKPILGTGGYTYSQKHSATGMTESIGYADEGIGRLEERFQETNDYWEKTYKDAFDRLSYYQAAKAMLYTQKAPKRSVSKQENAQYLSALEFIQQEKLNYTFDMMEEDIARLIELFHKWEYRAKDDPKYYTQGLAQAGYIRPD